MIFEFIAFFVLLFILVGLAYQFMYDIYYPVLLLSVLFYIAYVGIKIYFNRKPKSVNNFTQTQQVQTPSIMDKDIQILKEFITKNINEGFKIKIIKEALLKQGWPENKVDQAILETTK